MLSINTNLSSLIAQSSLTNSTNALNLAIERMTTGYKINHAKDNAANYSIATNITMKIGAYQVAEENCAMGLDMLATANGSLEQISNRLTRLRDLQIQASNGIYGEQSLKAINAEANALADEIERLYKTAEYNGMKLFATATTSDVTSFAMTRAVSSETGFIKQIAQRNTDTMTTLESVSDSTTISNGTYSISTAEELEKLATMTNNGQILGGEFVLADDIDLSSYSDWIPIGNEDNKFVADFDGNGHVISNLTSSTGGLFGYINDTTIKNLGVIDCNASGGGIALATYGASLADQTISYIENCFTTGNIQEDATYGFSGGIIGGALYYDSIVITDTWSSADVSNLQNENTSGGILGGVFAAAAQIKNCYSTGDVIGSGISGFFPEANNSDTYQIQSQILNSFSTGKVTLYGVANLGNDPDAGNIANCYYNTELNSGIEAITKWGTLPSDAVVGKTSSQLEAMMPTLYSNSSSDVDGGAGGDDAGNTGGESIGDGLVTLQIGINSDSNSQIGVEISFAIVSVDDLRMIGLDLTTDYLSILDDMLSTVFSKLTEYGSTQNRLESALDEISTQYENLISTRSTLRDADIAEVSSEYIRQQILQQASATLLSTANQSPSIALQLI